MEPEVSTSSSEPSAPQSTLEIAASVVEQSDQSTESPEQPRVLEEPAKPTAQEAKLSAAQEFIVAQGHKWGKREDGRTDLSWMPATTVAGMLERYADQRRDLWAAEHHAPLTKERDTLKADLTEFITAMRGDPTAFLETVAQHDPRYKSFLTPQEKVELAADANDPEPQLVLDQGADKYTESLKAVRAWDRRQAKREAVAETRELVKPFQQQQQLAQASAKDRETYARIMDDAQTWEGFGPLPADGSLTEHQAEVLNVLREDSAAAAGKPGARLMTLKEAHLQVQNRRQAEQLKTLAADDATRRAQYAKELNGAPRSTSVTRTGTEHVAKPGPRSTEDIAREIVMRES